MKELIIDKKTRLSKIKDKESYTKLILNTKVNPKSLKDFINVKDLTIKRNKKGFNVYNEVHINELPFKDNIETLILDNILNHGTNDKNNNYSLLLPNLKEITFINNIYSLNISYLNECSTLEKIFIYTNTFYYKIPKKFHISNNNIKTVIINDKHIIGFDYKPNNFSYIYFNGETEFFYNDLNIFSKLIIDKNNNIVNKEHLLSSISTNLVNNNNLYIPDYITNINEKMNNITNELNIKSISLNLNLLKTQKEKVNLVGNYNLKEIKKIILRSNNEMSLFENKEININDELKKLYIENNKLYIITDTKNIIIDKNSNKINKDSKNNKLEEKEEYFHYKKLLDLIKKYNDEELNAAMNIVGDKIIKKLTK